MNPRVRSRRALAPTLGITVLCLALPASTPASASGAARTDGGVTLRAAGRGAPWISLLDGTDLVAQYEGDAAAVEALENGSARSLALASGDYDEDGVPDVVCGYAAAGGLVTLHRGNVGAIYPNAPEARSRVGGPDARTPFLPSARVLAVPEPPELLAAGDFDDDGHLDLAAARTGGDALYVLAGDGRGALGPARAVRLPGRATALAAAPIGRAAASTGLAVGVAGPDGPELLVFGGPRGALESEPKTVALLAEATALAYFDADRLVDIAVAAGFELTIVHGRDGASAPGALAIDRRALGSPIASIATGDFDGDGRADVAALLADGAVRVFGAGDGAEAARPGGDERWPGATRLVAAHVSSRPCDDLVVLDSASRELHLVGARAASDLAAEPAVTLEVEGEPVAVLPMRLNADALSDLVVLRAGASAPTAILTAPVRTFTVTTAAASGPGSFGQAIVDSNLSPGADAIVFNIAGTAPFTIPVALTLPSITDPVTIDATTQPGFQGTPVVAVRGPGGATIESGLTVLGTSITVRGLAVGRFQEGILLDGPGGNIIEGNFVGVEPNGAAAVANSDNGVFLRSGTGNTVGGTTAAARNVISGNEDDGVDIDPDTSGTLVLGNYIGTDATGTRRLGNADDAVDIDSSTGNIIGGSAAGAGNVLSDNGDSGVELTDNRPGGNSIIGNLIGTDAAGTAALGNDFGIGMYDSSGNTIDGNRIAFNTECGVYVDAGTGNRVSGNAIFSNTLLGIDLFPVGPTANDTGDADSGANARQNFPVLTSVVGAASGTSITGTLNSRPSATFTIEFFASAACDPSGSGEGEEFVGSTSVTTDSSGNATFSAELDVSLGARPVVTATATDASGNTSEFSACHALAISLMWQPPDANASSNPPPRLLMAGAGGMTSSGATPVAYRVYSSSQPGVQPVPVNLVAEVAGTETVATVPSPSGAAFFVVTAVYDGGAESRPSNEISVGLAAATVTNVVVTDKKITATGVGFTSSVTVFVDGIAFTAPAKVKKNNTTVIQKKALVTGESIGSYITPGRTVAISIRNSNGGIVTVKFTR